MRIDWQRIRSESGGSELVLLAIPRDGVRLLLSVMEPLEWMATFRSSGYDFADWDDLQAVVAKTTLGLMEHQMLSTIVSAINSLTTAVENLSATICCVNPVSVSSPSVPLVGGGGGSLYDAPTPSEPPPYPFAVTSWQDYRCRAGEFVYQRLRALAENVDTILSVAGSGVIAASIVILGLVAIGVTVPPAAIAVIPILDSVAAFMVALASTTDELLSDVSSDDFHRDFVCAFSNASLLQEVLDMPYGPVFDWVNGVTRMAMNIVLETVGRMAWLGKGAVAGNEYIALDALPDCPFDDCDDFTDYSVLELTPPSAVFTPNSPLVVEGWVIDANSATQVGDGAIRCAAWVNMAAMQVRVSCSGMFASGHNPNAPFTLAVWGLPADPINPLPVELGFGQPGDTFVFEYVSPVLSNLPSVGVGSWGGGLGGHSVGLSLSALNVLVEIVPL